MNYIKLNDGLDFYLAPGTSLLDAGLAAGISLPYSCKNGRCSACKCKVLNGQTTVLQAEEGLSEFDKKEGWILSCVRTATTDLLLFAEHLGSFKLPSIRTVPCRIDQIDILSSDVIRVFLRLPPAASFIFYPGQYVDVIGLGGVRRSYSLASASLTDKRLELHIRSVDGGVMSKYWFGGAKVNDLLRLNGPLGTFFLRDIAGLDLVFLATGTGIAPIKAMLEALVDLAPEHSPKSVSVYWGGRTIKDIYFDMSTIGPSNTLFVPVISRPNQEWLGATGYVHDVFLSEQPDLSNVKVYACGSDAMIQSAKSVLIKAKLPESRFFSDAFVSSSN